MVIKPPFKPSPFPEVVKAGAGYMRQPLPTFMEDNMGYLGSALTEEEAGRFVAKYNKPCERICIKCFKPFESEGVHNRKCQVCKNREAYQIEKTMSRDIPVHKYSATFKRMNAFRGEIE